MMTSPIFFADALWMSNPKHSYLHQDEWGDYTFRPYRRETDVIDVEAREVFETPCLPPA